MKTIIHQYHFLLTDPAQREAYLALEAKLVAMGLRCHETWGGNGSYYNGGLDGCELELETTSLFDNQWNTAPLKEGESGLRVFDWAQDYPINFSPSVKRGHWLEQTEEMAAIRRDTVKCGYCGHMEPAQHEKTFCDECLGSTYLNAEDLKLTRLRRICDTGPGQKFPELTDGQRKARMPLYLDAQINGRTERDKVNIAKRREQLIKDRDAAIYNAEAKFKGMTWLMDRGFKTGNIIHYTHTDRWQWGWSKPISEAELQRLKPLLALFPYNLEFKLDTGATVPLYLKADSII